jgi:hypothetical protein
MDLLCVTLLGYSNRMEKDNGSSPIVRAHLNPKQGVAGSNPVIPTGKSREPQGSRDFFVGET